MNENEFVDMFKKTLSNTDEEQELMEAFKIYLSNLEKSMENKNMDKSRILELLEFETKMIARLPLNQKKTKIDK